LALGQVGLVVGVVVAELRLESFLAFLFFVF